jgi:GGDEF domain-containing protein
MGLLEKALDYKKEINRKGKITLLDTIKGPAETEMLNVQIDTNTLEKNISESDKSTQDANNDISDDLFELPEDDNYSPLDTLKEQKGEQAYDDPNLHLSKTDTKINNKKKEKPIPSQHDINNPLTSDDDPILPKDIDAVLSAKSKTNNGLLEIEPYIIPEDTYDNKDLKEDIINGQYESINLSKINKDEKELKYTGELGNISPEKYQENMTLYEIGKEISRSETKKVLFEVVIFSIMGQIGTSSASIMIKSPENDKWIIVNSSGLKSSNKTFSFEASTGILKNIKKDIIDIEKFKNNPEYTEYYRELTSISARLLIPWFFKGKVLGILALGAKITDDDYTAKEKDFIQAICEASAIELNKINIIEKIKTEYEVSKTGLDFLQRINNIQEKIIPNNSIKKIKGVIISEFNELGIIQFTVFSHGLTQDNYIPIINSNDEVHDPELTIDETNAFISFINKRVSNPRIEDFNKLEVIKAAFKETEIKKMNVLWVYPVDIGGQLLGYTVIFKVKDELLNEDKKVEIDNNLDKLSKMILFNITNIIRIDPDENRYIDNIGTLFKRINSELARAKKLNIPLTLIIFSIKNYKRYGNLFGYVKAKELIDNFAELIKSRLSETDFSARYDRNKILIVFPGKDKKFAEPFANTIRNEFMQRFKKSEMQLLITFLLSEFPEDGDDILSLVDSID